MTRRDRGSPPIPGDVVAWVSDVGVEHRDFGVVVDPETVMWLDSECNVDHFNARSGRLTTVVGSIRTVYRPVTDGWRQRLVDGAVRRFDAWLSRDSAPR